ncbi:hypothetical protein, partial [Crocosphaera chwakensis]
KLNIRFPPYLSIFSTTLMVAVISGLLVKGGIWLPAQLSPEWNLIRATDMFTENVGLIFIASICGLIGGLAERKLRKITITSGIIGGILGTKIGAEMVANNFSGWTMNVNAEILIPTLSAIFWGTFGASVGTILAILQSIINKSFWNPLVTKFSKKGYKPWLTTLFLVPVIAVGILLGTSTVIGFTPLIIKGLIASCTPLVTMLLSSPFQLITSSRKYRELESKNLIKS